VACPLVLFCPGKCPSLELDSLDSKLFRCNMLAPRLDSVRTLPGPVHLSLRRVSASETDKDRAVGVEHRAPSLSEVIFHRCFQVLNCLRRAVEMRLTGWPMSLLDVRVRRVIDHGFSLIQCLDDAD
jgi:hypothetical protein